MEPDPLKPTNCLRLVFLFHTTGGLSPPLAKILRGEKSIMAEITAAAVKQLRERTDLPMMECKKALVEAGGDEEKAVAILKENFKKVQDKRKDNETAEGRIFTLAKPDCSEAAMVEIQCESAPVASGASLEEFGNLCVKQLLEGPGAKTPEDLLSQKAPNGSGKTLNELFEDMVNKIREKIVIKNVDRAAGPVGVYVHHDGKTGVMFQATGEKADQGILRDVAMHIAALQPAYVNAETVAAADVKAERDRLSAEAKASGKPDNIIEKMVDGRMKNFFVEQGVLEYQAFAKDDTKPVSQALAEKGLKAKAFTLRKIGN
jgi:elongation factor Ts